VAGLLVAILAMSTASSVSAATPEAAPQPPTSTPRPTSAQPPASPPPPATPLSSAALRDLFEKADKLLRKADDAARGKDAGRVSQLLRRADEEIARFEAASGIAPILSAVAASREEAGRGDLPAAEISLRRARPWIASLSDYTVPRSAEVAFRSAQDSGADGNAHDFLAALDRFEAATLVPVLQERIREARAAVAKGRALLVRNDMKGASKEIAASRTAFDGLTYAGALSRSRYGLLVASELLRDKALLAARDQAQKGLRDLKLALPLAPEPALQSLVKAQEDATAVWKRINRPAEGDSEILSAASDAVEAVRQQQRAFRAPDLVAQ
jgi:hypothetical protein